MEANCPERIEKVFIVRGNVEVEVVAWYDMAYIFDTAPSIFPVCYNIVKHIFDESTRRKIFIFGCKFLIYKVSKSTMNATYVFIWKQIGRKNYKNTLVLINFPRYMEEPGVNQTRVAQTM